VLTLVAKASERKVLRLLHDAGVSPIACDDTGDGACEVVMRGESSFLGAVGALVRAGIGFETGRYRGAHGDPTMVAAAQRIAVREGVR
jgi:hypothetical protein